MLYRDAQDFIPNQPWPSQGDTTLSRPASGGRHRQGVWLKPARFGLGHRPPRPGHQDWAIKTVSSGFGGILEPGKQQVVLPDAIDTEIFPGIALADKAVLLQEPDRPRIGR